MIEPFPLAFFTYLGFLAFVQFFDPSGTSRLRKGDRRVDPELVFFSLTRV